MTIKFKQDPYDYYRFNLYHWWARPERKLYRLRTYITIPVLGLIFLSYKYLTIDEVVRLKYLLNLALFVGFVSFVYVLLVGGFVKSRIERNTAKLLKGGKNTDIIGDKQIVFNEDVILTSTVNSKSEIKWDIIEKLCEDFNYFFIYISSASALVIPKDKIEDQDQLRMLIDTKIKKGSS